MDNILTIVFAVLAAACSCLTYYFHVKAKIYAETENAVNNAEQDDKTATEKMRFAVDHIYSVIPAVAKPLFTRAVVEKIVQKAFDKIEEYAEKQAKKKG